jgi:Tfp pilus assembly protein PilW
MRSTRPYRGERGFSVIEIFVGLVLGALVAASVTTLFAHTRRVVRQQTLRIETQQALRASLETLARDLRLSGACLPVNGEFMALRGTDSSDRDSILTRTGLVRPNRSCIRTALRQDMVASDTDIGVVTAGGFTAGMRAYIRHPNGAGESFDIVSVDSSNNRLVKSTALSRDYPEDSGVYAIDEREYAIDTSDPERPALSVKVGGGDPIPFAFGIESMNIQYQLERNCPNCTVVNQPTAEEWALVRQLSITVTARSSAVDLDGRYLRITRQIAAKPRNLLPG